MTDRVAQSKSLVQDVLAGRKTPDSDPAVFEDDLLYLAVGVLRQQDLAWLEARLSEGGAGSSLVRACLPPG